MPHPHARLLLRLLGVPLVLGLWACASHEDSPPTSRQLQRDINDKILTKDEQKAVISDLQSATNKKQGEATAAGGGD